MKTHTIAGEHLQYLLHDKRMTFLSIYTITCGPFWSAQEIHERGVVEENTMAVIVLSIYFKERVERAEVDVDITLLQTEHNLNIPNVIIQKFIMLLKKIMHT